MLRLNGFKNLLMERIGRHTLYIELLSVNRYDFKRVLSQSNRHYIAKFKRFNYFDLL